MSHIYSGKCGCSAVKVRLLLPCSLDTLEPRRCDCDYCVARDGVYLSHPGAELQMWSRRAQREERQGDEIARLLHCSECGELTGAICELDGALLGAVRPQLLDDFSLLPPARSVSPRLLSREQKIDRWKNLWMRVEVIKDV